MDTHKGYYIGCSQWNGMMELVYVSAIVSAGLVIGIYLLSISRKSYGKHLKIMYEDMLGMKTQQIKSLKGKLAQMYQIPSEFKNEGLPIEDIVNGVIKALPPQFRMILQPVVGPLAEYIQTHPEIQDMVKNSITTMKQGKQDELPSEAL